MCIDIVNDYVPWAASSCTKPCAVAAIVSAVVADADGHLVGVPISEEYPLYRCRHFFASICVPGLGAMCASNSPLEKFYSKLGVTVLGTLMEGNCGIDVMCQMLSDPSNDANLKRLRTDTCYHFIVIYFLCLHLINYSN